jgi:putative FmdB family regulatory protein
MPIFEYLCRCGRKFETLVLGTSPKAPVCPRCGASGAERLHSRFAAVGSSKSKGDDFGGGDEDFGGGGNFGGGGGGDEAGDGGWDGGAGMGDGEPGGWDEGDAGSDADDDPD